MSFNLTFAIFGGGYLVAIAWVVGLLVTKLRLSYYDNRMTKPQIKRARRQLLLVYVAIWLVAVASVALHDYA